MVCAQYLRYPGTRPGKNPRTCTPAWEKAFVSFRVCSLTTSSQCIIFLLILLACNAPTLAGPNKLTRRILILYEVGTSYPLTNLVDEGIRAALVNSPYGIEFYREYMDTVLFPDPADQQLFRNFYVRKYANHRPDIIITVGSSPLQFMADTHRKSFPGVPVVFCFPTVPADNGTIDSDATGVEGDIDASATVAAALRVVPKTLHLVVVGGVAPYDRRLQALVKEQLKAYEGRLDISYLTDLATPDLLERLKHLPNHTVVLLTAFGRDLTGTSYNADQSGPMIVDAANAPVFGLVDRYLNHGEVGGRVSSAIEDGKVVGNLALRILNGENPEHIPIIKTATKYMFDWRALKRWSFRERDLPPGSIVLNRQPTVWEAYKWYIIAGSFLILIEGILISGLLWQHARRRQTNLALEKRTTELQAREELLKIFVKNVPAGVAMLDRDMRYLQVSDRWCADYGVDASQILGRSHYEAFPDMPDWWREIHRRALDGETLRADEDRWERKSGTAWVRWEVRPWLNTDETAGGILIFAEDITRRKQADEALSGMSRRLIQSQEQERTRIARELHDDINQQLALVAVELDRWGKSSSNSDIHDHVEKIRGRIMDISHDIQALSHQLHSSKLEYLGLATAARGFCKEISQQHNVLVNFTENGVPRNLPEEVSVCLFRVLQEALQNAVKYSGADHFEVSLCGISGEILLTIRDHGVGFDVGASTKGQGLGLVSMRERVSLVKGTIVIKTNPMDGTEITVRVPVDIVDRASELTFGAA